ncbi:hypothetical protein FA95DRAFT_826331 [Auriscalpium vulgare]|uniref:Uncharacterized protein n=2 Tax=Auriscalpium vulgare TaxID=40419 RepID=A0ACB8R9G8_9AGAM|nr:hypothetical protein FA95DRAFT_826467 [Auriscalpium vulgare]KAI0040731.1 hypothetical protein FA95DRAFT_826331 [Auriscalpium vulgare]
MILTLTLTYTPPASSPLRLTSPQQCFRSTVLHASDIKARRPSRRRTVKCPSIAGSTLSSTDHCLRHIQALRRERSPAAKALVRERKQTSPFTVCAVDPAHTVHITGPPVAPSAPHNRQYFVPCARTSPKRCAQQQSPEAACR